MRLLFPMKHNLNINSCSCLRGFRARALDREREGERRRVYKDICTWLLLSICAELLSLHFINTLTRLSRHICSVAQSMVRFTRGLIPIMTIATREHQRFVFNLRAWLTFVSLSRLQTSCSIDWLCLMFEREGGATSRFNWFLPALIASEERKKSTCAQHLSLFSGQND